MRQSYYDSDEIDPNFQELQRDFVKEFNGTRDPKVLVDIMKHCNTYALYQITYFLQSSRKVLDKAAQKDKNKNAEVMEEIALIDKMQDKLNPIFMKKWIENCPDRRIIFNLISLVDFTDKQKKLVNETFTHIHSIGYIKHFIETVDFADQKYLETFIKNSSDYCLKYEYGMHFPKARKDMIAAMKKQADSSKAHEGIIRYYADELRKMKNAPAQEEARML